MKKRPQSVQEHNLQRLGAITALSLIVSIGFVCWWLYEGVGFFKDEMSFNSAYGPRKVPRIPLPAGTVPRDGMGYDRAQLGEAPLAVAYAPALAARLYHDQCGFCHAYSGRGDTAVGMEYDPRPPDLNQIVPRLSQTQLFAAISNGRVTQELATSPPIGARWHAFRLYLTEAQRRQLVDYLRQRFGSGRPPTEPRATTIPNPAYHIVGNPPSGSADKRGHE